MFVIYDTLGAYGGSHTLMLRMCQWLRGNGIEAAIICTDESNKEIVGALKELGVRIICADLKDAKEGKRVFESLLAIEPIQLICFSWYKYLDVERIKKLGRLSFDTKLYCIHPETFKKGIGFRSKLLRKLAISSYKRLFLRMSENGAIISLDEVNILESERYLECKLKRTPQIIRLPMFCEERDDKDRIVENGFSSNILLTASRADIPYKGYLIGLIDDFRELKTRYPSLQLEIVSDGDDIEKLKAKIAELPESLRANVWLHGWMQYEELKTVMRQCRVFIGMGTSVFDAALQYKPAIAVAFNTLENRSDHFVEEKPAFMDSEPDCPERAITRIEQALGWDSDEYRDHCLSSFRKVKDLYDINERMKELLNATTKHQGSILRWNECIRHHLNHVINDIRFRNVHFAEYDNLSQETMESNANGT